MTGIELNIADMAVRGPVSPTWLPVSEKKPLLRVLGDGLWTLGEWFVGVPRAVVRPAPDVQVMTRELRQWTEWSARRLGQVLGTSHTTILAIEEGRPLVSGHSGDLRRRLDELHSLVSRIHVLAGRDAAQTARLLVAASAEDRSAVDWLRERDTARAYLTVLDALNPPAEGMLVGTRPAAPGRATAPLHE